MSRCLTYLLLGHLLRAALSAPSGSNGLPGEETPTLALVGADRAHHKIHTYSLTNRGLSGGDGTSGQVPELKYDVLGVKMSIKRMAFVAIVVWGMVAAMIIFYLSYLRERQQRTGHIKLDKNYSQHSVDTLESYSSRGHDLQLGSLGNNRMPPRSIRAQVILPKRQPMATAITEVADEEDLLS